MSVSVTLCTDCCSHQLPGEVQFIWNEPIVFTLALFQITFFLFLLSFNKVVLSKSIAPSLSHSLSQFVTKCSEAVSCYGKNAYPIAGR